MELFLKRFADRITGIIAGPDRLLFRGRLQSIGYVKGLEPWLRSQGVMNQHFTRWAKRITAKLVEHAKELAQRQDRRYRHLTSSSDSKEDLARHIMEEDGITEGLICVFSCVEPCRTFKQFPNRKTGKVDLDCTDAKCLHLYFYLIDREFGFMHVRLQTWVPFAVQVCVNGREWLARCMDQAGISYQRHDNCFTEIGNTEQAQRMLDRLTTRQWVGRLNAWARRFNALLKMPAAKCLRGYYWTVRQDEFATDILFDSPHSLAQIYPALLRHAVEQFHSEDILRFLSYRVPARFRGEFSGHAGHRWEGVRVKHRADENSIKMYDKAGSVLRVETTINNARRFRVRRHCIRKGQPTMAWLPLRKGIVDLRRRHQIARAANARYLNGLSVVGEDSPAHRVLDSVTQPVIRKWRRYRPLHPADPQDSQRFAAMLRGEHLVHGFTARDLYPLGDPPPRADRETRRRIIQAIGRWIRLCRAHRLVEKATGTHFYRLTPKGHLLMTTALKLRQAQLTALAA